ncbi:hypothetical protein RF11_05916 [Thelohanellus kitauei]|uniref:Reverse transcriptase domain-containing protein n=1 Tax=Thelohanellus kitauei TaxID=669202 RepID=A0A0C2N7B8_THEKT|nr:hypothetical protein RF11_05916 [Thelohanellus kitauei]
MRHSFPLRSAVSANTTRENPLLAKLRELPNWNLQNEAFALLVIKLESIVHLTTKQFDWSSPSHDVILLLFYKKSEIFGAPVAKCPLLFFPRKTVLVQKTMLATTLADFRPITCLDVALKNHIRGNDDSGGRHNHEEEHYSCNSVCVEAHIYSSVVSGIMAETSNQLYTIYVDLTKAFDRVPYPLINRLVYHIYGEGTATSVWIKRALKSIRWCIPTSGDPMSLLLFNLAISPISLTQHRFNHIKIWRTTDDPSESILSLIARFGSLGPTVNNRKSAAVLTRIAHPTSDLAFPVVTSEKPYKYLAVREVAKPLNGLNVEGCVRKLFGIAEKFVSCGHLNALNTVRSINYFALSHLWFLFAMLCLLLPMSLDGLGPIDPSCVLHKIYKETLVLSMRVIRPSSPYALRRYSFEQRVRMCIVSLESKIPVDIPSSLSGNIRLDAVKLLHASAICLKREEGSLKTPMVSSQGLSQDNTVALNAVMNTSDPTHTRTCRHCRNHPEWPYHLVMVDSGDYRLMLP